MRIHHLNCGTMCPFGGRLFDGATRGLRPAKLTCHCLLLETDQGLVLVDTGFGLGDIQHPHERLSEFFYFVDRPKLTEADTAVQQVEALGFHRDDVRHIVLTHLDFDHAGGLTDFPLATVHVYMEEYLAATARRGIIARGRYRPQQWNAHQHWMQYEPGGDDWYGFRCVRNLQGLPPEILMVPLTGHTLGHCGIAVQGNDGWLLNAGDAYFYREEMHEDQPNCTPGLRFYQKMMEVNREQRLYNQDRLRNLKREHGGEITTFCSHDHIEFIQMQARSPLPAVA